MKKIVILTDYKGKFGSKHFDFPYRSGFNKKILNEHFVKHGFEVSYMKFPMGIQDFLIDDNTFYLYTSSEDSGYHYKSYIEDIIYSLELLNCKIIPKYKYLRANNNKVFMELLRQQLESQEYSSITSSVFGTLEELIDRKDNYIYPVVIKTAEGASGTGVFKADDWSELLRIVKKISKSFDLFDDTWDFFRSLKHKGYIRESRYRKKYILQNFIPNLNNDWKVYYFGKKYYVFFRPIFKHRGFRASGGGYNNYLFGENAKIPEGLLEFVESFVRNFDVPHASIDVAFDGESFHIIEFQFTYFGTAGIPYSSGYFSKVNKEWKYIRNKLSIEEVYVESIVEFINKT